MPTSHRVQQLEIELKRFTSKKNHEVAPPNSMDAMAQEITGLKKDLETAERIAKNSEVSSDYAYLTIIDLYILPYMHCCSVKH